MRGTWKAPAAALAVGALFLASIIGLFQRQFASGEIYPEFSTLRTDRLGARLIYDSLAKLPGITLERNFLPMEFLPRDGVELVLLGVDPLRVNWSDDQFLRTIENIARRGNRVVVAMHLDPENRRITQQDFERRAEPKTRLPGKKAQGESARPPLETAWKVKMRLDPDREAAHPLYITAAEGWTVRSRDGERLLSVERQFSKGAVALLVESDAFTNGAAVAMNRLTDIAAVLGGHSHIIFDEQHLGIAESGSVVGMARQFRLMGFAIGLAICAILFLWKNASAFPPPAPAAARERFSGRTSHAGLLTLLKRHIPPAEIARVCWSEWLSTNGRQATPELKSQAEAILAGSAARPVEATHQIEALLRAKGRT